MSDPREQTDRISGPDPRQDADADRERVPSKGGVPGANGEPWSRRRFGKTALGVTPIIATLYGRPLSAASNCMPSGWASGNTSNPRELRDCGGRSPQNWQGQSTELERSSGVEQYDQSVEVSAAEGETSGKRHGILDKPLNSKNHGFEGFNYKVDGKPATIRQALSTVPFDNTSGSLERELIRYGTAALLNARFEPSYSLFHKQDMLTEMVAGAVLYEGYTTDGGDHLYPDEVLRFLKNTMDSPSWGRDG